MAAATPSDGRGGAAGPDGLDAGRGLTGSAPPPDAIEVAAVFAGGVVGALARAALAHEWTHPADGWPWATVIVNLVGAFVLGFVAARYVRGPGGAGVPRALVGTGFCGALTTFSTLQLELVLMVRADAYGLAVGYAAVSLAGGLAAVRLGDVVARWGAAS